ncbi:dermonecrotic toxin domain-containing protein [Pseudomonas sp.]|uniref:dermonecrotic toxin domain-containing protein n=1 Tax=Pseudomonas sp. TaxID=306 RepID=UPI003CC5D146
MTDPAVTRPSPGPHQALIESALPPWLLQAPAPLREQYFARSQAGLLSSDRARVLIKHLQTPEGFCAPLLQAELDRRYPALNLKVRGHELVRMVREREGLSVRLRPLRQTLLQAALQNFDADQARRDGLETGSVIIPVGVFTFDVNDDLTLRYKYPADSVVRLAPDTFASLCRNLDLGRRYHEHVAQVLGAGPFSTPDRAPSPSARRRTFRQQLADQLAIAATTAALRGEVSTAACQALLDMLATGRGQWAGEPLEVHQVRLLASTFYSGQRLRGIQLFAPHGNPGPCMLYMPGEPHAPLREFATGQACADYLREQLRDRGYQQYFQRFLSLSRAPAFFARLNDTLSPQPVTWPGQFPAPPQPDPNADIGLRSDLYNKPVARLLANHHMQLLLGNAQLLAVPSAIHDRQAHERTVAWWEGLGWSVLNAAAFSVPGVGELMAVVGAVELVKSVCLGVDEWQHGHTAEAMGHFAEVAENVVMIAAATGASIAIARSPFVDTMVPVVDNTGHQRLLHPDLSAYASEHALPEGALPNEQGQYWIEGKPHVVIGERLYEQRLDPDSGAWHLHHANLAADYRPLLQHNGEGAWQHVHEAPLEWEGTQLMRRFGALTNGLSDLQLIQAQEVCGVSAAQLRQLHITRQPLPAGLHEALLRWRSQRAVDTLVTAMRSQEGLGEGGSFVPALLARLPRWPQGVGVREVLESGSYRDFLPGDHDAHVEVTRGEWRLGQVAGRVVQQLNGEQRAQLFGDSVENTPQAHAQVLADRLAEQFEQAREEIRRAIEQRLQPPVTVEAAPVSRDFAGLSPRLANDIAGAATDLERTQLRDHGRVPVRVAEEARMVVRRERLARAMEGLMDRRQVSLDRDRLAVRLLSHLSGWSGNVRVELHAESIGGRRLAVAGHEQAAEIKVVVRRNGTYQAYDTQDNELSGATDLFEALAHALPDQVRAGLRVRNGAGLGERLAHQALRNPQAAAQALGQRRVQPWFRSPVRTPEGAGYSLSGRGQARWSVRARLRALYPALDDTALLERRRTMRRPGDSEELALLRLETEHQVLHAGLSDWANAGSPAQRLARAPARQEILRAWRRETPSVHLSGRAVGELPVITADFSHLLVLHLEQMGLVQDPSLFIGRFSGLRTLSLANNGLVAIPEAVRGLQQLETLTLSGNHLALNDSSFAPLRGLPLRHLRLRNAFQLAVEEDDILDTPLTAAMLEPLTTLNHLRGLDLSANGLSLDDAAFEQLGRLTGLWRLNLNNTLIELNPRRVASLNRLRDLRTLDLGENRLGVPPDVSWMINLQVLGLANGGLREWPQGLRQLLLEPWSSVEHVNLSHNQLQDLPFGSTDELLSLSQDVALSLQGNPFNEQARAWLRTARVPVGLDQAPVAPGTQVEAWRQGAPADLLARVDADRLQPEAQGFYRVIDRVADTADYLVDPVRARQRLWAIVQQVVPGEGVAGDGLGIVDLRAQLFEQAQEIEDTCGDGISTLLDRFDVTVAAWQAASSAQRGARDMFMPLRSLGRQLLSAQLVDEYGVAISRAREVRRDALLGNRTPSPLHPLDDIEDVDLLPTAPDEVEIRLVLRTRLQRELDLRSQPAMRYGEEVSSATVQRVAAAVRSDLTAARLQAWLVEQPFWRLYWRKVVPDAFAAQEALWRDVLDVFEDAIAGTRPFTLAPAERLDAALAQLGQFHSQALAAPIAWRDGPVVLTDGVIKALYDWIARQRDAAQLGIVRQQTEAQFRAQPF